LVNSKPYKTDPALIDAIKFKQMNIQKELTLLAGFRQSKSTIKETQAYIAEELKKPKMSFKISDWERVRRKLIK